jgi:hypothetical protein
VNEPLGIQRISVLAIKEQENWRGEKIPAAEIEISGTALALVEGHAIKKVSDRRFLVPTYGRNLKNSEYSIHDLSYGKDVFDFSAITVDHINQAAQEVSICVCFMDHRKVG